MVVGSLLETDVCSLLGTTGAPRDWEAVDAAFSRLTFQGVMNTMYGAYLVASQHREQE